MNEDGTENSSKVFCSSPTMRVLFQSDIQVTDGHKFEILCYNCVYRNLCPPYIMRLWDFQESRMVCLLKSSRKTGVKISSKVRSDRLQNLVRSSVLQGQIHLKCTEYCNLFCCQLSYKKLGLEHYMDQSFWAIL